ncbi:MAG: GTP cyclohydrolase I FolE [Bacteroidetes bacterium]|jgi:GTP cyclohydrolase I|nr:GTP cyclohydrolase I FolE [Bacteroidota bacterium]
MKVNGNFTNKSVNQDIMRIFQENPLRIIEQRFNDEEIKNQTNEEKIRKIEIHFAEIMKTLGLNLQDDSLRDTPLRVAKMYVNEIFKGLREDQKPAVKLFDNKYHYKQMLVEKNIKVHSTCEHHFVPILGKAHVAYISSGKVIGLSKLNRIVEYFCKKPQVQERLTEEIARELKQSLQTDDVAVVIDADHMCVKLRGIEDEHSTTITSAFHGQFEKRDIREQFFQFLKLNT